MPSAPRPVGPPAQLSSRVVALGAHLCLVRLRSRNRVEHARRHPRAAPSRDAYEIVPLPSQEEIFPLFCLAVGRRPIARHADAWLARARSPCPVPGLFIYGRWSSARSQVVTLALCRVYAQICTGSILEASAWRFDQVLSSGVCIHLKGCSVYREKKKRKKNSKHAAAKPPRFPHRAKTTCSCLGTYMPRRYLVQVPSRRYTECPVHE